MATVKKRFKNWIIIGVVALGIIALLASYSGAMLQKLCKIFPAVGKISFVAEPQTELPGQQPQISGEEKKIVPVIVQKALKSDFEDVLPVMGTVKGFKQIELRFEVNGIVDAINFKEGDLVKRRDAVAALNQEDAILKLEYSQTKLKTAQTQMLTAKKKLEIHQKLYQLGTIIKSKLEEVALEYEGSKSQAASAQKEVAFAKQEVQKTYITSQIDGIMGSKDVEVGEFVTSNTKIGTLIDIASVYAEMGIIEKDLQKIALGQEAKITVDAYPNAEFKGVIDNVLPIIEGKSRTITCRIKIDNASGQLLPGMFARGTIFIYGRKGAIVVPANCLRDKDNNGAFESVFLVDEDKTAHLKDITIGYITTDNGVVDSGLEEGELVVTEARAELTDGAAVEILETQEAMKPTELPTEEGTGEKELVIH